MKNTWKITDKWSTQAGTRIIGMSYTEYLNLVIFILGRRRYIFLGTYGYDALDADTVIGSSDFLDRWNTP